MGNMHEAVCYFYAINCAVISDCNLRTLVYILMVEETKMINNNVLAI